MVLTDGAFRRIAALMYEAVGLSFSDSKKSLMSSRLASRIQKLGLDSFDAYAEVLEDPHSGGEFQTAVDLLTTNETYFFREPHHFELLERELVARRSRAPVSVWSAASSFGDEAYSVAMLLADLQQRGQIGEWSVLGTDISRRVLLCACEGIYPAERLRNVSEARRKRHCLRGEGPSEGQLMIHERLRQHVKFGQLNLMRDFQGLGPFDVVFLRNVLIYFDPPTKIEVVDRVLTALRPGGLFFMGTAEGRVACKTPLRPIAPGAYRKEDPA